MSSSTETFDPKKRRLCPDGACIGVLDDAGRCKVCGHGSGQAATSAPAEARATLEPSEPSAGDVQRTTFETTDGFDPRRQLCPDGACIGVIRGDGRCSVCKRSASASEPPAGGPSGGPVN